LCFFVVVSTPQRVGLEILQKILMLTRIKMKKSKFTPTQIAVIPKNFNNVISLEELIRKHGILRQIFYLC